MHKGHSGASMGGRQEISPNRAKNRAKKRRAQDRAWKAKNGPVTISFRKPVDNPVDDTP